MGLFVLLKRNSLPSLLQDLSPAIDQALLETAVAIQQDAGGMGPHAAPYRTGNLRRSHYFEKLGEKEYIVASDRDIAPYNVYVHWGTRFMAPRPWLKEAYEYHIKSLRERVRNNLMRVLK
jgi:HK97 gp10 family phage protein